MIVYKKYIRPRRYKTDRKILPGELWSTGDEKTKKEKAHPGGYLKAEPYKQMEKDTEIDLGKFQGGRLAPDPKV